MSRSVLPGCPYRRSDLRTATNMGDFSSLRAIPLSIIPHGLVRVCSISCPGSYSLVAKNDRHERHLAHDWLPRKVVSWTKPRDTLSSPASQTGQRSRPAGLTSGAAFKTRNPSLTIYKQRCFAVSSSSHLIFSCTATYRYALVFARGKSRF